MSLALESYRVRLPLSLIGASALTAMVLSLLIAWHTYRNLTEDLVNSSRHLSDAMITALSSALRHDDVWGAYRILRGPKKAAGREEFSFVVVDDRHRIFASNRPREFPVATPLDAAQPRLAELTRRPIGHREEIYQALLPGATVLMTPIEVDGNSIGALLVSYPRDLYWPRFAQIMRQGGLSMVLVLGIVIPLGWYWGKRLVQPLLSLSRCMERMTEIPIEEVECNLVPKGRDEVAGLTHRFKDMLQSLKEKQVLEDQMVVTERLAAVGRLASGVAHEINNPLGGMLVAVDTLRQPGLPDGRSANTLALIQRGLKQVQDTVSALLVEARPGRRSLSRQDIQDTQTLVQARAEARQAKIEWQNLVSGTLPLPATLVRQIVINLLLNAVAVIRPLGHVQARFEVVEARLRIHVCNDGEKIPAGKLPRLFEPYYTGEGEGAGMGLWITYQIVQQLGGFISVESDDDITCFEVELPLPPQQPPLEQT